VLDISITRAAAATTQATRIPWRIGSIFSCQIGDQVTMEQQGGEQRQEARGAISAAADYGR
jgi:hypothetical protein